MNASFGVGLLVDARVGLEVFVNTSGRDTGVGMVGIRDPSTGFAATSPLKLLARDTVVVVQCFVDKTVVECFFQRGRAVLTVPLAQLQDAVYCHFAGPPPVFGGYTAFTAGGGRTVLLKATVWDVRDIWV